MDIPKLIIGRTKPASKQLTQMEVTGCSKGAKVQIKISDKIHSQTITLTKKKIKCCTMLYLLVAFSTVDKSYSPLCHLTYLTSIQMTE